MHNVVAAADDDDHDKNDNDNKINKMQQCSVPDDNLTTRDKT